MNTKLTLSFLLFFCSITIIGQNLVINEILADPAAGASGDANGDGTRDTYDDEFVEIINNGISAIDISGYTLSDAASLRHTFPASTVVPPGESIVVFGGGTPSGIPGIVQTASSGGLSLNNSGDDIVISTGITDIVSYTYGSEGGDDQSLGRNPDITGDLMKHSDFAPGGTLFSPGKRNDDGTPLPVELSLFSASSRGKTIELLWATATEVNNYGFEIERKSVNDVSTLYPPAGRVPSINGNSIEGDWKKIGFKEGFGNSNSTKYYSFTDNKLDASGKYLYRLKQIDIDGGFEYSDVVEAVLNTPSEFELNQNYPNPFNPSTTIKFTLPENGHLKLSVFDVLGKEVAVLLNENLIAGYYSVNFDGTRLNSGIYFYRLETNKTKIIKKMILIK